MSESFVPVRGLFHRVKTSVSRHRHTEHGGLKIVRDPESASIDIVAVHGLGGEGFKSWTTQDPKSGKAKPWLDELLGQDLGDARILTYSYVTGGVNYRYLVRNILYGRALDLVKELGAQRARDGTGHRPVFFIAHSLGGWIVKRALIISKEAIEPDLCNVELSTCGVVFFGTLSPGRPSSPSPLASVIRRTSFPFHEELRRSTTRSFQLNPKQDESDEIWLENQMEGFKGITANLPRLSFYETKESHDGFIVEKKFSLMGSDGSQIPLSSSHADLVKFKGRTDVNYQRFASKFKEMIRASISSGTLDKKRKEHELSAVHRPEYLNMEFSLPAQPATENSLIIPRPKLLSQLEQTLQSQMTGQASMSIAACWGSPGAGKTTLAKHYAEMHQHDTSVVFWVWSESWESVVTSFLHFGHALVQHYSAQGPKADVETHLGLRGVDEMLKAKSILDLDMLRIKSVVQAVKDWLLRPNNDRWLLVFDNVESSFDVFDFIPMTRFGRIIMTSRDSECCSWGTKIRVGPMTADESMDLLALALERTPFELPAERQAAQKVINRLANHPQSITSAASAIRRRGIDIVEYAHAFELQISLSELQPVFEESRFSSLLIKIASMLAPAAIPLSVLSSPIQVQPSARYRSVHQLMQDFQQGEVLEEVLRTLFAENVIQTPSPTTDSQSSSSQSVSQSFDSISSLSNASSRDLFVLDPSVRMRVREELSGEDEASYAWLACQLCTSAVSKTEAEAESLLEIHDFARIIGPHARTCYEDWSPVLQANPCDDNTRWFVLGRVCMTQGAPEQAIGCFELSLQQAQTLEPVERIQVSLWLASIWRKNGQPEKSLRVLNSIDVRSVDQMDGFRIAKAKASAAAAQGEFARAEDSLETLEQEQAAYLGVTDIATVDTVQQLAGTLEHLGKIQEAQALYRRVWLSCQSIFGVNHSTTLAALEDLARISLDSHAIDEAENYTKQAVEISARTLGEDHPNTARAVLKLAVIHDIRCAYDPARATYQRALTTMENSLGRASPSYTAAAENLALSTRWHGHSLCDDGGRGAARETYSYDSDSSDGATLKPPSMVRKPSIASEAAEGPAFSEACRRAFDEAERLYLDVLAIRKGAPEVYSEEDVLDTASKLSEMYEMEAYFENAKEAKMRGLKEHLQGMRRSRGGRGVAGPKGLGSSMSDMSIENWR